MLPSDRILLKGIACLARVGVFDWERKVGCPCEVDLEIDLDLSQAVASDCLEDTLNYATVVNEVVELAGSCHYHLLERLAGEIAARILIHPRAQSVRVVVKKKKILGLEPLDYAAVDIRRSRE